MLSLPVDSASNCSSHAPKERSLGEVTKVVELIRLVRERFRPGRQPSMDAHILQWEGRMAAQRKDDDAAAAKFSAAIDAFATLQRPFWLAVTVAVIGGIGPFAGSLGFLYLSGSHRTT